MDAKERAEELIRKFDNCRPGKQTALSCVEVILEALRESHDLPSGNLHPFGVYPGRIVTWLSVKKELEKV